MLFDKLCSALEGNPKINHLLGGGVTEIFKRCSVFQFTDTEKIITNAKKSSQLLGYATIDLFALPFKNTCVEDEFGLVIFQDSIDGQYGSDEHRRVILAQEVDGKITVVNIDRISNIENILDQDKVRYSVESAQEITPERPCIVNINKSGTIIGVIDPGRFLEFVQKNVSTSITVGLQEVAMIMNREFWIVEQSATSTFIPRPKKNAPEKILRTNQRPLFTVLTHHQVRDRLHLGGTHDSPMPHWRRRHIRTLQHEIYGENIGKQIVIPATWIGPSECIVDGKRYRVRIDL